MFLENIYRKLLVLVGGIGGTLNGASDFAGFHVGRNCDLYKVHDQKIYGLF